MINNIFQAINEAKAGRYIYLLKEKDLGNGVSKLTEMRVRVGVKYANMKVNEGRQTGPLPWGSWVPGYEGWVVEHTNKAGKHNFYLRVTSCNPSQVLETGEVGADVISTSYQQYGRTITKAEADALGDSKKVKENNNSSASIVYAINFDNILKVGTRTA